MSRQPLQNRGRRLAAILTVSALAVSVLLLTAHVARQSSLQELLRRNDQALQLYAANIRRELSQYAYLPKLLAHDERVSKLLRAPDDRRQRDLVNRYLQFVVDASDAAAIYVMNRQGLTVASSNWQQPDSFVGDNYSFRPYYQQAMQGRLGRYYALGSTSHVRGYYFAFPVHVDERIVGVVALKVSLDSLEAEHEERRYEFVVTDRHGIAFLSTRPQWRYRAFKPLADDTLFRVAASQRYVGHSLLPLPVQGRHSFGSRATLLTLGESGTTYLQHGMYMPQAGWWVYILSNTAPVEGYVLHAVLLAAAVFGALVLAALIAWQRRVRLIERGRYEQAAKETAVALATNRRLTHEIEERRRTEIELRRTRNELVQAAKLAAIGQLAAGINHELNQPLTSIRFFAGNAKTFLDRSRLADVRSNLLQIDVLSEHMGKIIRQLKLFSRKTSGQSVPVLMTAVVEAAIALLAPRLKREHVQVEQAAPTADVHCLGDLVRLEQVVVNLISNAIQAMNGQSEPRIEIAAERRGERIVLSVRDHGPGIPEDDLGQIFDPFFTTKEVGEGLGLGLSISMRIIEEMGGTMQARNHAAGGAIFTIELPAAAVQDNRHE